MPGCAAVGCNNRSEKGYIMKCFPRDPKLRRIWQERVARADWEPSNNSFLCHVHFEPQEWSITRNGRIRLKKNAVPSIFTVTSTRKSHKKRTKLTNIRNENEFENECSILYQENDTEYSSIDNIEEKDSDSQDIDDPSMQSFVFQTVNHSLKMENIENKTIFHREYKDVVGDKQEDVILISDDNIKINDIIKGNNSGKDLEKKKLDTDSISEQNSTNNLYEDIKTEIKQETEQISLDDSYDEIEAKLKQICDGYREEDSYNTEKLNSMSKNQEDISKSSITRIPFHKNVNYKYSLRNEMGNILINDMENVEILFGTESGEEHTHISKHVSYDKNISDEVDNNLKIKQVDQHSVNIDNNKEIGKIFSKDLEKSFNKENVHVTPNIRAAIKRKRRTREEIMKSIKRSIRNTSYQDTNSLSNSDSDNVEMEKELNISKNMRFNRDNTAPALTKFTVKVTGDPDDVFDIMQDLFKNTRNFKIQGCNDTYAHQENNAFVTSVITIEDSPIKANANKENISVTDIKSILSGINDQWLNTKLTHSDEGLNSDYLITEASGVADLSGNCSIKYECQSLQRKVKMQEDIIKKLTNQLILYKTLEKNLQSRNLALELKAKEVKNLMHEFNTKTGSTSSLINYKKNVNSKQTLIEDLSSRINYFEETNKKLMKNITIESQQKRKLEGQIKQRDNQIKELNWKLEKASKFLERAEKNTNTYRRKMLNMQTIMRRKKLLDEKMSRFNELLMDGIKEGYSEKALIMAVEIKEASGKDGYDKLLSFGFPLPPLSALQVYLRDNLMDSNENNKKIVQMSIKHEIDEEYDIYSRNDIEIDTKDSGIPESVTGENILSGTETVTGTVQDIFDENNDGDDFSTNEIKEHFILQLNEVM